MASPGKRWKIPRGFGEKARATSSLRRRRHRRPRHGNTLLPAPSFYRAAAATAAACKVGAIANPNESEPSPLMLESPSTCNFSFVHFGVRV